jgi:hypothetical protein
MSEHSTVNPATLRQRGGDKQARDDGADQSKTKQKAKEAGGGTSVPVMEEKTNVAELKCYHETPAFLQHNRHILSGYRVSYRCVLSPSHALTYTSG